MPQASDKCSSLTMRLITDKGDILKESGEARRRGEKKVITYLESQIKSDNRCG